ncbi:MAG TPA: TSUP family transporter, partial [Xanthobacteraceae bacterium]|nr:TSUP family transporter [Xanthobacteraceae bacterium]
LLATISQETMRLSIGVLLILYSAYSIARPAITVPEGGAAIHAGVGVANGLIGGLTGLGGIAVTVWGQLRGGSKDAQRAVFQPVMFATFLMTAVSLGFVGAYTAETMKLYALALPALVAGIGCGIWLYGKLDDAAFRRVILFLLLASGASLVGPALLRLGGIQLTGA